MKMIAGLRLVAVAALASLSWAGAQSSEMAVTPVASPTGPASAQPQLSASSRGVLLSWIERSGSTATLKMSEWTSGTWSPARTVSSGDNWFVNWADVPSVMRLNNGTLVAHWLQKSAASTYAYDVRLSRSEDDGRTWSPSFLPHHDATPTEHGFASLFPMPGGGLGLVWLDGRAMKGGEHDSHGAGAGAMSVRFAAFDESWKQVADTAIDTRVCECCPTSAAVTATGVVAAYRDRSEGEVRDVAVVRFEHGMWSAPRPVHEDNWKIAACPVNGPGLSAVGKQVALSWFTAKNDQGQAWMAFSSDEGRTFGAPIRLDDAGALGRVDVELLPDGRAVATWIEFAEQRAQFRMRVVTPAGVRGAPVTIAGIEGSRASGYPRLARMGSTLVFAWTESTAGALQVKTATASIR
jgi:hypothetical protein